MTVLRRFVTAELVWAAAIFLLILPLGIGGGDQGGGADYVRWLARAMTLAAFPAGLAVATTLFARPRPMRELAEAIGAAALVAVVVFAIYAFAAPPLGDATLSELLAGLRGANDWETRNHTQWAVYSILLAPVVVMLHAAIGAQVGIWATHALPAAARRILYWLVGIGLMVSSYAVYDSTYEGVVLHANGAVGFAAFYTLLVPLGICAGLGLPTLALLRGAQLSGSER